MKIVYIAHKISGDIDKNLEDLCRIIKHINFAHDDIVPSAPYISDLMSLDDNNPMERVRGFQNNTALLKSGAFKELWLTGDKISMGMMYEIELCKELGIPVINMINQY